MEIWKQKQQRGNRLLIFIGGVLLAVFSTLHADTGTDWLTSLSAVDGSIASPDSLSTPFQSTSEALRTFTEYGESDTPVVLLARDYLNLDTVENTEFLARRIIAASDAGVDVATRLNALLARQNTDGGFGDQAGSDSTVLDTAFALEAAGRAGRTQDYFASLAIGFLQMKQHGDGGWADGGNDSTVFHTALALTALSY